MATACPHCRFQVELEPGFGAATCPACDNVIAEEEVTFPAPAAAPVDMSLPPEESMPGGFLASNSDFISGPGDPAASTDGELALDVPAPPPADFDAGTVFPATEGNLDQAEWDSMSSAPPALEEPIGMVGEPEPAPAPADPAAPAYDAPGEEWGPPPESFGDPLEGGAIPEPFAADAQGAVPEEDDPYSGLPVSWENSAPGLPIRPRLLPTVNEDGTLHDETSLLGAAAADDDAFFAASAPAPDPMPPVPVPPPPPAPAAVAGAAALPPPGPPPPPTPRVAVELEAAEPAPPAVEVPPVPAAAAAPSAPASRPSTIKPDAPGAPPPSFAPQRVGSEFRAPERPTGGRESTAPAAPPPSASPEAPWATAPTPRTPAKSVSAVMLAASPAVRPATASSAALPGPRSRMPLYLGGGAVALVVLAAGGFGLSKVLGGGGEELPIATPAPVALESPAPAPVETIAAVEATPDAAAEVTQEPTPEPTRVARGAKTPKPKRTPKAKATPTPKRVVSRPPVPTRTPLAVTTIRPGATPLPSATKLAMTAATPTPRPAPTSSFLDAAPRPRSVGSTAGSRFGANPNVDMRDARYKALESGHKLLDAWKTAAAAKQYKKVVKANDTFADGHYWYGYASALQGEHDRACTEFNRYLVLAPAGYYAAKARTQIKTCK